MRIRKLHFFQKSFSILFEMHLEMLIDCLEDNAQIMEIIELDNTQHK